MFPSIDKNQTKTEDSISSKKSALGHLFSAFSKMVKREEEAKNANSRNNELNNPISKTNKTTGLNKL